MAPPKEKKAKKSSYAILKEGFTTIKLLDNTNIYGVVFSECISNLFKEGMWQRVLTPYILFLAHHNKAIVGNAITLNSTLRAAVGVLVGRFAINRLGADSCFCITGVVGMLGIFVNVFCLMQESLPAVFFLNAVWGIYTGMWNSCLEVEWARSIVREHREQASSARQVTNKITSAIGPLLSIGVFYAFGNNWSMPLITFVMLVGTAFTVLPVILCFRFDRIYEVRQEICLLDVEKIVFPDWSVEPRKLRRNSFAPSDEGPIRLSYPLKDASKYGKLRVFTPDLRETNFILGKQFRAWFKDGDGELRNVENMAVMHFLDPSRPSVRANLESFSVFLKKDGDINETYSQIVFHLHPNMSKRSEKGVDKQSAFFRGAGKLFWAKSAREFESSGDLKEGLLSESSRDVSVSCVDSKKSGKKDAKKVYEPNIVKANMIVSCDVINAVASGMSLKFMDIFLIEEYGLSPAGVLSVQVFSSLTTAWLTPVVKQTMTWVYNRGYKSSFGVVLIWAAGCCAMAVICIPNVNLYVCIVAIVLMGSLFSCTKAYNRARLVNALPHDRVANYMVWDSLNKANQGGITILGAQVVQWGGYRACFICTLILLILRTSLYLGYSLRKGGIRRKVRPSHRTSENIQDSEIEKAGSEQSGRSSAVGALVNLPNAGGRVSRISEGGEGEDEQNLTHLSGIDEEIPHQVPSLRQLELDKQMNLLELNDAHHDDDADLECSNADHFHEGAVGLGHGEADSELFPPEFFDDPPSNDMLLVDGGETAIPAGEEQPLFFRPRPEGP